ncbi:MAG: pimeloyl-ACP methyl ester carboxylesterase [Myxococcota bacterium]|jgi:pimeloyl-ACP methyl ester carboxylesterase
MIERFLTLRDLSFCLCETAPEQPTQPPVLILHGWLDQGASWRRVAAGLAAAGHRVIAPDHRGHGRSAHAPPGSYYHFPDYITDVDALLRALDLPPVILIGHSMGGTIATTLAALRPERIARLVLIDGLGPPATTTEQAVTQYRTHLRHLAAPRPLAVLPDVAAAAERMRRMNPLLPAEEATFLAARVTRPVPGGVSWCWDRLHQTRSPIAFDLERHLAMLRLIAAPTTVLIGANGWYPGLPDLQTRIDAVPDATRIDLPTGHSPHMADPDLLVGHLLATR